MDDATRKRLFDYVASGRSEIMHIVDGRIRLRPEWIAGREERHLAATDEYDWCDCPIHDPRP